MIDLRAAGPDQEVVGGSLVPVAGMHLSPWQRPPGSYGPNPGSPSADLDTTEEEGDTYRPYKQDIRQRPQKLPCGSSNTLTDPKTITPSTEP